MQCALKNLLAVQMLRKTPRFKGKNRLARIILKNHLNRKDCVVEDKSGFKLKVPSIAEPLAFDILINGCYEPRLLDLILRYLRPGDSFVDIGANIGCFSMPCASKVGLAGKVISIEASPKIWPYLEQNITQSGLANIDLKKCVAADQDSGYVDFYEAPADRFGMGSVGKQFDDPPISICRRTLDSLLRESGVSKPRMIKIDVEGYEAKVFIGASQILSSSEAPMIAFEFADWAEKRLDLDPGEAQRVLMGFGYKVWVLEEFLARRSFLERPITKGFFTLIASKQPILD